MYKLSEAAADDIEGILTRSMLDFGLERTETYFQSLTQCLELLGDNPEMGSTMNETRPGYRCFLHESHAIFYTPREQGVLIVRILHKRMDADRNLRD
ncbi:MAG: type II toxin-antitoxin system RelE/ParE family toxin [Thiogranum sp.]